MAKKAHNPNEISAGRLIVRAAGDDWEICLINSSGYWGYPKGHLETGETPLQAALREVSEEVGLNPDDLKLCSQLSDSDYVFRASGRLIFKRVHHFLVEAPADAALTRDPKEVDEAKWVPLSDAPSLLSFDDGRKLLQEAEAALKTAAN